MRTHILLHIQTQIHINASFAHKVVRFKRNTHRIQVCLFHTWLLLTYIRKYIENCHVRICVRLFWIRAYKFSPSLPLPSSSLGSFRFLVWNSDYILHSIFILYIFSSSSVSDDGHLKPQNRCTVDANWVTQQQNKSFNFGTSDMSMSIRINTCV